MAATRPEQAAALSAPMERLSRSVAAHPAVKAGIATAKAAEFFQRATWLSSGRVCFV